MFRLLGLVISIGLADSLNPSTIAVALYLSTGERAPARLMEFTLAVFGVYFLGGAAVALGPGQLLLSLVPHPSQTTRYALEVVAGAAMLLAAALLWLSRQRLARRDPPDLDPGRKGSWVLGASITAVELPTAFPYFAAIAAIVGSGVGPFRQLFLLVLFNVCFVLPLLVIVGIVAFGGGQTDEMLARFRDFLQRRWPVLLAWLLLLAGVIVIVLGVTGLTGVRGHVKHARHKLGNPFRL
jgi:cytochrome c biogenesis protein CcdA